MSDFLVADVGYISLRASLLIGTRRLRLPLRPRSVSYVNLENWASLTFAECTDPLRDIVMQPPTTRRQPRGPRSMSK